MLHAIADHVVDGYIAVAEAVQDDIDEVEIDVFSTPAKGSARGSDAGRIYQLKREVLEFKRAVSPLLRPMQLLSERPMRLIDPDIQSTSAMSPTTSPGCRKRSSASTSC